MPVKKDFKNIGAQAVDKFFSTATIEKVEPQSIPQPEPKAVPKAPAKPAREIKSRRVPVLMHPSLYDDISKIAYVNHLSVNEQISQILKKYAENNAEALEKYKLLF